MKHFMLLLTALFVLSCGGGSSLGGDISEDALRDTADFSESTDPADTSDPVELPPDAGDTADADGEGSEGEVQDPCRPQDARAEGPCAAELPGFVWNGEHCVGLGTGCECAGSDCALVYETVEECVDARRECYDAGCEPQVAELDVCIECAVAVFLGAFWDGRECYELVGCRCIGEDCAAGFASLEECRVVQSACDGAFCRAAGGLWFPAWAGLCGFTCGALNAISCESPFDSCDCLAGRSFQPGAGCVSDPSCTQEQLCRATMGTWHPQSECICGFTCGVPGDCEACLDSCDCGPHRNFDASAGCAPDSACEGATLEGICTSTGGRWDVDVCGGYFCGHPNYLDPCVVPGCDCGRLMNFDHTLGCLYDDACYIQDTGDECRGWAHDSSCRSGLVCCAYCVTGCMSCSPPCCPDDPYCMDDGCPPPPP